MTNTKICCRKDFYVDVITEKPINNTNLIEILWDWKDVSIDSAVGQCSPSLGIKV